MNKVILMGNITRDPEIRYSAGENAMAIAKFSIAINRRFKRQNDQADADFFNITAFGKLGEFVEKYLHQGSKILVVGRLQNDNYTNKDGQKVYGVQIIAEEIEFAERANQGNSQGQAQGNFQPQGGFQGQPQGGFQPQGNFQQGQRQAAPQQGMPRARFSQQAQPQAGFQPVAPQQAPQQMPQQGAGYDDFMNLPEGSDEDLPFMQ